MTAVAIVMSVPLATETFDRDIQYRVAHQRRNGVGVPKFGLRMAGGCLIWQAEIQQ